MLLAGQNTGTTSVGAVAQVVDQGYAVSEVAGDSRKLLQARADPDLVISRLS